jgi:hypothetical protein
MTTIICDIDGTIADCTHRLHHITGETKDWDAFYNACAGDAPIHKVIDILEALIGSDHEVSVVFISGRRESCRKATAAWLDRVSDVLGSIEYWIHLRADGDRRPDHIVKRELFEALPDEMRADVMCVLEDRSAVVEMWRSIGLTCLQVAKGDF